AFCALEYLEPLTAGRRVLEFGSGMSSLWFARKCRQVISVESDSGWFRIVRQESRDLQSVQIIHAISQKDYLGALSTSGGKFDLILVDGIYRNQCLDLVRPYLEPGGLLIVDNTD